MQPKQASSGCAAISWGIALLVGAAGMMILIVTGGWTVLQGIFAGGVIFLAVGILLSSTICRPLPRLGDVEAPGARVKDGPVAPGSAPGPRDVNAPPPGAARPAASHPAAAAVAGTAVSGGFAASAEGSGHHAREHHVADAPAHATGSEPQGTSSVEAVPSADPAPAAKPGATPTSEAEARPDPGAAAEAEGPGTRPEALSAPRGGEADDLKKIKGIGPKLEELCHSLGFYHFDQIANWTADEVAWVDQNLTGFKGRVTRDDWVAQARLLASGEDTEFSRKVDKGDVY